ncbi:ferredoxin reductase [Intrasporangium flavum]|uniref:ferredoxin reductase n=1 Tax=Intrasporangium flavum TaxID=1428657 RepID=UPI00096FD262|nr:ferredoxin reductase [Intrasporangium flavum]
MARVTWQVAYLVSRKDETPDAVTLVLGVPEWPGHLPGQHVDVRLTAPDGYSAQRSYSLAAPDHGAQVELTVQVVQDGEVSSFLARDYAVGDPVEVRGPVGGWFVWSPQVGAAAAPVLLLGGGSGVVPLMAMVRARHESGSTAPMHLVYSVRTPADVLYADELERRGRLDDGLTVTVAYTRSAPPGDARGAHRITAEELAAWAPYREGQRTYVCGPTGFVDAVADALVDLGHDEHTIRTERFGPSGG